MQKLVRWLRNRRGELIVLAISSVWVIALTYPLIVRMDSSMYAVSWNTDNPGGWVPVGVWSTWWTRQAWAAGVDFRMVSMIGAPFGVDWTAAPYQYPSVYLTTMLSTLTGELVAHNLIILASFPLSALTAYWLGYELTRDRRAALVGGLIYAFSTYHWGRATVHFNMALVQWVPLYLLALFRWARQPSPRRAVALGAAFALVLLENYYYGYFMLFPTVAFVASRIAWETLVERKRRLSRERIVSTIVVLVTATLIIVPFVWPFVGSVLATRDDAATTAWVHTIAEVEAYSARPWMYLVPSYGHPLWGPLLRDFYIQNLTLNEQVLYLGLFALGLAGWGGLRFKRDGLEREVVRDSVIMLVILLVMLWTSAPPQISIGAIKIPTPSYFLFETFPMFRVYDRIGGLAMVAVSALAAIGVMRLLKRWSARRNLITGVIIVVALFDSLFLPPMRNLDLSQIPAEYEWLARQRGDPIIVEYPLYAGDAYARMARYLFYQRIHAKRLFNGSPPNSQGDMIRTQIVDVTGKNVPRVLGELGVKYVLIHLDFYSDVGGPEAVDAPPPDLERLSSELKLVEQFGSTRVYEVSIEQ